MTAPAPQKPKKITMTTRTTQQFADNVWVVRFVMPHSWILKTSPQPNNAKVSLRTVPAMRRGAIRFSGWSSAASIRKH
jgi:hypothetical protein